MPHRAALGLRHNQSITIGDTPIPSPRCTGEAVLTTVAFNSNLTLSTALRQRK